MNSVDFRRPRFTADGSLICEPAKRQTSNKKHSGKALTPEQQSEVSKMLNSTLRRNIEPKMTIVFNATTPIDYNGTVFSATTNLARSDDAVDSFTGNVIRPQRLRMRYSWSTNQDYSTVRLLCFQWFDAAVPSPSGLLQNIGVISAPFQPILWTNRTKIRVLYDRTHCLKPRVSAGYDAKAFSFDVTGGFSNMIFASGSTNPQMGGIYYLPISDDAVISYPLISFASELIYTDA